MLTIPLGHTLAALTDVLGEVVQLSSVLATRRSTALAVDTGERLPMSAPDQVLVRGMGLTGSLEWMDVSDHLLPILTSARGTTESATGSPSQFVISMANGALIPYHGCQAILMIRTSAIQCTREDFRCRTLSSFFQKIRMR
jgi:hypothetical protein